MADEKKDFYNVVKLTGEFEKHARGKLTDSQFWYCASALAVAQQLTVISGHLGELVKLLKGGKYEPNH